jgi:hypothetical protein
METPPEKAIAPNTQLSRIYKTDPFGFPLYPYDEEQYRQSRQEQGIDPDAISVTTQEDSHEEDPDNS